MEKTKILILEHDCNGLEMLQQALRKSDLNYCVRIVETKEGFEQALVDFKPEIILSAYSLPSFDGLAAYDIKTKHCADVPFIIVSGSIGEENAVELIKVGITDYVLKEKMYQVVPKIDRALKELKGHRDKIRTEQKLEEQNQQIKNILESVTDAFFSVDQSWMVRYCNKEAELLLLPRDKFINRNLWEVFPEAKELKFFAEYSRVMNERVASNFEEYFAPLDMWFGVNAYPSKDGISVLFRDITETKRQEQANTLEKKVLRMHTRKGARIEDTIKLLFDGIQQIHSQLICNVQRVRDIQLFKWGYSQLPEEFIAATEGEKIDIGTSCSAAAAYLNRKVFAPDISVDRYWIGHRQLAQKYDLKAAFAFPLRDLDERIIGVFTVFLKTARMLTAPERLTLDRTRYNLQHILKNYLIQIALEESEGRYRDLFNFSPQPMWVFDPETLRFLMVNEAAIRHYGYSREEFSNMTIADIRPQESVEKLKDFVLNSIRNGSFSEGTFEHLKKDGTLLHVYIQSNLIDYGVSRARLVLATDITERIKIEQALKLSEQRFKALVQEGSDLISIQDRDGYYKYVSPALSALFGVPGDQLIGQRSFQFIHPDDRSRVVEQFYLLAGTQKRAKSDPFRFKSSDGTYRWLEAIATNLLDDPAVEGIVLNSKDITDIVTHLQAIEAQNARLHEIAWIQSHIVRAPLARIMGLIDIMKNCSNDDIEATELTNYILTSAHELDDVIKTIVKKTEAVGDFYNNNSDIESRNRYNVSANGTTDSH